MRFLAPEFLHLAWLALLPLALYLFRKKAQRVPVSTLLFFRSLSREHQESAWLRKLKKWLSLLLTLLVIILAVLALARPVGDAGGKSPPAVVLLVDQSASMAARDESGETCLKRACQLLSARLRQLPDDAVISLVTFDARTRVLLSRSRNRRECLRLLNSLEARPVEGRLDAVLPVVRRLADLEEASQIWHAGDVALTDTEGLSYAFISAALERPINVGITGFQIRQAPLARDRYEAFVKVSAAQANVAPVQSTLEVRIAGRLAQLRELELQPGQAVALVLPLEGVRGQSLQATLKTPGDCLGWDDAVAAQLPQGKPLVVAWIAQDPDPFTELALTSLIEAGRIEMLRGSPDAWPLKDKPDVYVFEHWLPSASAWPADRPVIALSPRQSAGPIRLRPLPAGVPHEVVRSVAPEHPLLFRVASNRLALTQTAVLDLPEGWEPLWLAGTEPVLATGEVEGQRLVVSAFSPSRSEQLALLPAFPLLLGNALYWCAQQREALIGLEMHQPGELLEINEWMQGTEWDGRQFVEFTEAASGGLLDLQRIGSWRTASGRVAASALVSAAETDVPARQQDPETKPLPSLTAVGTWGAGAQSLLVAVLSLLLLESWLFHRKAVF